MENNQSLPVVDLGAFKNGSKIEREKIAARVNDICCTSGFLIIKNHNFPEDIKEGAWQAAKSFFENSFQEKNKACSDEENCPRGYLPIEGETLGKTLGLETPPDRKETFSSGPLSAPCGYPEDADFNFFYGPNIWPSSPDNFEEYWTAYYKEMEKLGVDLMELLAAALDVNNDYFVKYHTHHISALRCQNYPSLSSDRLPGQLRAGEHTDYGTLTILNPDPHIAGLEVKSSSGNWIKAPMVGNSFIINIGDMMAHWTNNRWVSTLHRVVEPIGEAGTPTQCRQSIAYFMNPNFDAEINIIPTCLKKGDLANQTPVLAGQYLMDKFKISL